MIKTVGTIFGTIVTLNISIEFVIQANVALCGTPL